RPGGVSTSSRQYRPPVSSALVLIVTREPNSQKSSPSSSRNPYPTFARSLDVVVDMSPPSFAAVRTAFHLRCHPVNALGRCRSPCVVGVHSEGERQGALPRVSIRCYPLLGGLAAVRLVPGREKI